MTVPLNVFCILATLTFGRLVGDVSGQSASQVAKNSFASVVLIATQDSGGRPLALGSGFFVREGVVVTNLHVIEGANKGYVKLVGQQATMSIEGTTAIDASRDLVLLKVTGASRSTMPLSIELPDIGETIYAVGNPIGLEGTFSQGIVSGIRDVGDARLIQITAPISPGSSGGTVLNSKGEVIGVAVATFDRGQNLNFAVPASDLARLLKATVSIEPLTRSGAVKRESNSPRVGAPATDGLAVSNFLWNSSMPGVTPGGNGQFTVSLKNNTASTLRRPLVLVVFFDKDGEVVDSAEVTFFGDIGPGLAKRASGRVDASVKKYTTPVVSPFMYAEQPNTRLEYRVLGFEVVR